MLTPEGQKELCSYMERATEESMAGCTANVVLITDTEIYCANAGDSRSIIKFGNVNTRNYIKLFYKFIIITSKR